MLSLNGSSVYVKSEYACFALEFNLYPPNFKKVPSLLNIGASKYISSYNLQYIKLVFPIRVKILKRRFRVAEKRNPGKPRFFQVLKWMWFWAIHLNIWKDVWWYRTWRWREVGDSSQSFSSDTLHGISSEWSGDNTELVYIQKRRDLIGQRPMCLTLQGQILRPRSSSHFISSLRLGSDFHQIFESSSLQTKRIRLLLTDLLNSWTFHWLTVPTFRRGPNYIFNQWQLRFFLFPKPFLIGHCFNQ